MFPINPSYHLNISAQKRIRLIALISRYKRPHTRYITFPVKGYDNILITDLLLYKSFIAAAYKKKCKYQIPTSAHTHKYPSN